QDCSRWLRISPSTDRALFPANRSALLQTSGATLMISLLVFEFLGYLNVLPLPTVRSLMTRAAVFDSS
ncbi:hypothetical protein, partial [Pseudomonas coronafaciens]|uniref:hypothetical protein n=1 Tax=Pseudomonas coronafaciens TaxID=53409 RepID=UPI001C80C30B